MRAIRTMVIGGVIFLVPFGIVLLLFGKVFGVARRLAEPVHGMIPVEAVAGVALANVLALGIILLACLLAGVVATSPWGQRAYRRIDEWLLNLVPRYAFVKSMTESIGGQKGTSLQPVLVRFDDLAQIAFEVERGPGDQVTVYLPGSPDPWSGSVAHVSADRVDVIHADFATVVRSLRRIGSGTRDLWSTNADLTET